jgi:T-complex protein 1 subunit zeta
MSSLQDLSQNAEIISKQQALRVNSAAAVGLLNVLCTNLGPTGTLKLLVGGAGQLKLTKDGVTLLKEMQIQHPTAALIARTATAQDEITGDGTTSTVLLVGELLRQSERLIGEGLHPRIVTDGLDQARDSCLEFLKEFSIVQKNAVENRDLLLSVARTSLGTKLDATLVTHVSQSFHSNCVLVILDSGNFKFNSLTHTLASTLCYI